MKKNLLIICCLGLLGIQAGFSQAKKPTLMVVPSDAWCNQHGFMIDFDNQGTKVKLPDYKRAFQESPELLQVTGKINTLMSDRGFPLKNMESVMKSLEGESAEDNLVSSKNGSGVAESPIDKLKKVAKADIILQITWTVNSTGPKKSINYNLQGLDAYTDKQVAGSQNTGAPSFSAEVPVLLEEAILANMDAFTSQLQAHFDDMFKNGREITVRIKKFSSWDGDLEKEYGGKELNEVIQEWMKDNTVEHRFSTSDNTENMMYFEQVRMPLYDKNNTAIDARAFVKGLSKFLSSAPYNITNKLMTKGLGQATIILGEK